MIPHSRPEPTERDIAAVAEALRRGHLSQGREVTELEARAADMFGMNAVAVGSGTAAVYLSLAALDVDARSSVIIPSYTCNSIYSAVRFTGASAICADTEVNSVNVCRSTVEAALPGGKCTAVIPHICGYEADIESIRELGIPVVEDCAQALGGRDGRARLLGTRGDIGVFSFYATKLAPAGEGGMCITRNDGLADTIRRLRNCDEREPDPRAFNFKMSDIAAALSLSGLGRLQTVLETRSKTAGDYDAVASTLSFRLTSASPQRVCFRYLIDTHGDADTFISRAASEGIQCRKPVWKPLHRSIGGDCPNADSAYRSLVSVPVYDGLKDDELAVIRQFLSSWPL